MTDRAASDPAALPAIIHLPDQSQPEPAWSPGPKPGRHTGRMKGRHFGPRPVDDPRSQRIDLRVTPAQKAGIIAAAEKAGLSVAAFICLRTLGSTGPRAQRGKPGPEAVAIARIMAALGRCGSNINQLLQKVDSTDLRGVPELLDMHAVMRASHNAHHELVAAIKAELGGSPRARRSKPGPDEAARARIVAGLDRSGGNLNQLLQKVNSSDFRGAPDLLDMHAAMKAAHKAHHELVAAIKAELGF